MGGKIGPRPCESGSWYSSRIPGVLEEVVMSLQQDKPLFVIGAFGGCARMIFDLLEGRDRSEMHWSYQQRAPHSAEMRACYEREGLDWLDYSGMAQFLHERGLPGLKNGLSVEQNRDLATTGSVEQMIELVLEGLRNTSTSSSNPGVSHPSSAS